jgi:hypothetical protein
MMYSEVRRNHSGLGTHCEAGTAGLLGRGHAWPCTSGDGSMGGENPCDVGRSSTLERACFLCLRGDCALLCLCLCACGWVCRDGISAGTGGGPDHEAAPPRRETGAEHAAPSCRDLDVGWIILPPRWRVLRVSPSESLRLARMLRLCRLYRPAMLRLGCSIGVAPLSTVKASRGCLS